MLARRALVIGVSGLSLLGGALPAAAQPDWLEYGPAPLGNGAGRVAAIAPHPSDPEGMYVGAASGGVWKRQNGKLVPLTDRLPAASIGALAVDPKNGDVVYAGSGEPNMGNHCFYGLGVYKSTDGGASWTVLGGEQFAGRTIGRIAISPADSQKLFLSVTRAGGRRGANGPITGAKGHPGATGPMGVFRSSDGGSSWARLAGLPAGPASDIVIAPGDGNTLYAAIAEPDGGPTNGVYKSTDGGESWALLSAGPPATSGRITLGVAPSRADRIYALVARTNGPTQGVFASDDGGKTWTTATPGNIMGRQGNYNNVVAVDPRNPDTAFFGGVQLLRSTDGGKTFSDVTPPHVDLHALIYASNNDLLVGTDGGVYQSANNGDSWTNRNAGLGNMQFYSGISFHPKDREFFLGGFQDNGSAARRMGMWRRVVGADGGYTALNPDAPDLMFAQSQGAASLRRSTDGGATFARSANGIVAGDRAAFFVPIAPTPDPQVWLLGTQRVYRSSDGGASWTPISPDLTSGPPQAIRALQVARSNGQVVFAATTEGRLLVSEDGGQTFAQKLDGLQGWPRVTREVAIASWDDKLAVVGVNLFGVDQVRLTRDRGGSWTAIDGDLPDLPVTTVDLALVQETEMTFAGTDQGVYFTCSGSGRWHKLGTKLPNTFVSDVRYDPAFKRIVASTLGRGVWAIDAPAPEACAAAPAPDAAVSVGSADAAAPGGGRASGVDAGGLPGGAPGGGGPAGMGGPIAPAAGSGCDCRSGGTAGTLPLPAAGVAFLALLLRSARRRAARRAAAGRLRRTSSP